MKVHVANVVPGNGALANIYSDDGITLIAGSLVITDSRGRYDFYAADGRYDIVFTGTGITTYILPAIEIADVTQSGIGDSPWLVQNFENIQIVDSSLSRGGVDIGDEINKAYAALPASGGRIKVASNPAGCYNYSTPIALATSGKMMTLEGEPGNPVCLNYTPVTATSAITLDYHPIGSFWYPGHGIRDIILTNNSCVTTGGCGSSATGIAIGNTNYGAQRGLFSNIKIEGFGTAFSNANSNSWGMVFFNATISRNTTGYSFTSTLENVQLVFGTIILNGTGISTTANQDGYLDGVSLDSNVTVAFTSSGGGLWQFNKCHFENFPGTGTTHYINGNADVYISGGTMLDDGTTGNTDWYMTLAGQAGVINGLSISSGGRTATNVLIANAPVRIIASFKNGSPTVLTSIIGGSSTSINDGSINAGWTTAVIPARFEAIGLAEQSGGAPVPSAKAGFGICYGDPTVHAIKCSYNNGSFGIVPNGSAGTYVPISAGGTDLGSTLLPFGNLWFGTAATNNFKFAPAATAAARTVNIPDPLQTITVLPLEIVAGTSTLTANATLGAVTSQAAITTAAPGAISTDAIEWAYASAPGAGDSLCIVSAYVTTGNVNFIRSNPTAGNQNVSAIVINWRVIR